MHIPAYMNRIHTATIVGAVRGALAARREGGAKTLAGLAATRGSHEGAV
jgi:hypothetical protein